MMLGPVDYSVWLGSFLLEAFVVVYAFFRKEFVRYLTLNLYMLSAAVVTCGSYICIKTFGYVSASYFYYYYYTDSLLYVLMYFVLIQFYERIFVEMKVSRYFRVVATVLLAAIALFSYSVAHQIKGHLTQQFVVQLEQNLNFVGVVLVYVLWGAMLKMHETRTRLIQLVLALGVYYSATAGVYALQNLFPALPGHIFLWIPPIMGLWLPLAWAYTFTKVSEDARLAPARLQVRVR
jgi:hypothetical protein